MQRFDTAESGHLGAWSGILVYMECYQGKLHLVGLELIGEACRLAQVSGDAVYAVVLGREIAGTKEQFRGYPIEQVYLYETEDEYEPELYEQILSECITSIHPSIVLVGGTYEGRALAPRLAASFHTGLTADCTELSIDADGNLVQTRPAFGGNVMASILTPQCRPQFATVRPMIMAPIAPIGTDMPVMIERTAKPFPSRIRILSVAKAAASENLADQKILVVAGRGIRTKEDLSMIRELAELLGGQFASSRALVEKGWTSQKEQIGLSGQSVSPQYLIACGISGSVQFMAGMKHSKNIIAINNDCNARIFEIAHYPICADLYEVIPEWIQLRKQNEEG